MGGVRLSFHPAGHILGSAQVRLEADGEVWVVSGDYKREPDPTCEPFEVVPCDTFVTEATFGRPSYQWDEPAGVAAEILEWWDGNRNARRNSLLYCYALGKTQRILGELARLTDRPAFLFGEAHALTEVYRAAGVKMLPTRRLEDSSKAELKGALVLAPHSIANSPWLEKLGDVSEAFASGWMQTGAYGMSARYERGFVLSDHADWNGLVRTVAETGARRVLVHDGKRAGDSQLARHLRNKGLEAYGFRAGEPPWKRQLNLF
jgi:putative mRNA 3-end processing factor